MHLLVVFALLAMVGVSLGFLLFAATLPQPAAPGLVTDGAVVLTGGPGRLARGREVLAKGLAQRLLISGVDRRVRPDELRAAMGLSEAQFAAVDLGFVAENTRANAAEVAVWAQANQFRSIRVITSDFHARRARLEIAARLPEDVGIVVDAVASDPDLRTLMREYGKYLAAWLLLGLG
ncbi:YdcF family protein [Thermaurantiacus sp.]